MEHKSSYKASDNNELLICLLKGIQSKKRLPTIDETRYRALRTRDTVDFPSAVAAFAYSYNGKEWGGFTDKYYRNGRYHSYSEERKRYYKQLAQNKTFSKTILRLCDYTDLKPKNALVYCDPPYRGTTQYGDNFDSAEFWDVMREWSEDNIVLVSEYTAPRDFVVVASRQKTMSLSGEGNGGKRRERLYVHKMNAYIFNR